MESVSSRDTFSINPICFKIVEGVSVKRHLSQIPKNRIILKVFLEETPSIILKTTGFILKVSLQDTLFTIFTIENFEFMLKRDIFYFKIISTIFNTYWILWNYGKCLFKKHL